jgi:hypothetical protein
LVASRDRAHVGEKTVDLPGFDVRCHVVVSGLKNEGEKRFGEAHCCVATTLVRQAPGMVERFDQFLGFRTTRVHPMTQKARL